MTYSRMEAEFVKCQHNQENTRERESTPKQMWQDLCGARIPRRQLNRKPNAVLVSFQEAVKLEQQLMESKLQNCTSGKD